MPHNMVHVHYVLGGFLLFAVILTLDPLPHRMPFVFRIMMIIGLGPMHVLLGVPIMSGNEVFAEKWYQEVGRTWGPSLLSDQQTGGGLLWVFGDVVTIGFLAGLYAHWLQSDARDARRIDRQLDRLYGDAPRTPVPWAAAATGAAERAAAAVPEPRPPQWAPGREGQRPLGELRGHGPRVTPSRRSTAKPAGAAVSGRCAGRLRVAAGVDGGRVRPLGAEGGQQQERGPRRLEASLHHVSSKAAGPGPLLVRTRDPWAHLIGQLRQRQGQCRRVGRRIRRTCRSSPLGGVHDTSYSFSWPTG